MGNLREKIEAFEREVDGYKPSVLSELLYCPFCRSKAEIKTIHPILPTGKEDTLFQVQCTLRECGAMTLKWYPKIAAIQAWNRRAI